LDIVNPAVRLIVLTFVLIAGVIILAGPQFGIGKNIPATQKTKSVEIKKTGLTTSMKKPAKKEPGTTG
jgi:hypothetical protein